MPPQSFSNKASQGSPAGGCGEVCTPCSMLASATSAVSGQMFATDGLQKQLYELQLF